MQAFRAIEAMLSEPIDRERYATMATAEGAAKSAKAAKYSPGKPESATRAPPMTSKVSHIRHIRHTRQIRHRVHTAPQAPRSWWTGLSETADAWPAEPSMSRSATLTWHPFVCLRLQVASGNGEMDVATKELLSAAALGDLTWVKALAVRGADCSQTDYDGRTPLHLAATAGNLQMIRFLIGQKNVRVNVCDRFGLQSGA